MKSYPVKVWESSAEKSKWKPCKCCEILYKPLQFCGLFTQSIQTLYFKWYLKSYHFAIFLLLILLFLLSRLSNWVDLSFEYLSFSNKRKTIILFPSPPRFWNGLWAQLWSETSSSTQKYVWVTCTNGTYSTPHSGDKLVSHNLSSELKTMKSKASIWIINGIKNCITTATNQWECRILSRPGII